MVDICIIGLLGNVAFGGGVMTIRLIDRRLVVSEPDVSVYEYSFTYRSARPADQRPIRRVVIPREDSAAVLLHVLLPEPVSLDKDGERPSHSGPITKHPDPEKPRTDKHMLVFASQFRMTTFDFGAKDDGENGYLLELIGGRVKVGEKPFETALREIREETSKVADAGLSNSFEAIEAEYIASAYVSPRRSTEKRISFMCGQQLNQQTSTRCLYGVFRRTGSLQMNGFDFSP